MKKEIEGYVQDKELRKGMDMCIQTEKNRDRVETRTAYSSMEIGWMCEKPNWANLQCIGGNSYRIGYFKWKNKRMALLYFQPSAYCTGASQACPIGMVGGDDVLAAGCTLCRRLLPGRKSERTANPEHCAKNSVKSD